MIMTEKEIAKHRQNPNVIITLKGLNKHFYCSCGCNVFHHENDWDIFICNSCGVRYRGENG